eukprot:8208245-Alexandrium_andersonii.AAC.1
MPVARSRGPLTSSALTRRSNARLSRSAARAPSPRSCEMTISGLPPSNPFAPGDAGFRGQWLPGRGTPSKGSCPSPPWTRRFVG